MIVGDNPSGIARTGKITTSIFAVCRNQNSQTFRTSKPTYTSPHCFNSSITLTDNKAAISCSEVPQLTENHQIHQQGLQTFATMPDMSRRSCCGAMTARLCTCLHAQMYTRDRKLPDIHVPHYEEQCECFSCEWVGEKDSRVLLSRMEPLSEDPAWPVANPTYYRVSQHQKQRLLTHVPRGNFGIMNSK